VLSEKIYCEKGGRSGFIVHVLQKGWSDGEIKDHHLKLMVEAHLVIGCKP